MRIDLMVLDIAGTTVYDGDAVHACLAAALMEAGVPTTRDEVNAVMGMPKPFAIATLTASHRGAPPSDAEVSSIFVAFERRMIEHYRSSPHVRPAQGAEEVLRALRARGTKVVLDTGFSRAVTDAVLGRLGWGAGFVDATVASDEVANGRPHPDMIRRAMELTGVTDARRVGKVGDTPADLQQGMAASCALVVGVTSGSHTAAELARHPHTHLVGDLTELLPVVDDVENAATSERRPGQADVPLLFTPGPLTTGAAVKQAMMVDLGSRDHDFIALVARVRRMLLQIAGTTEDEGYTAVPIQGSGTFAVEAMLGTLIPPDGRLLVLENGAYGRRIVEIARVLGIRTTIVSAPPSSPIAPADVRAALRNDDSVTHVVLVHCETTTGVVNPLTEIGEVVAAAGRRFLVDAMSSFGAIAVDVGDHAIEALAASSNKCLEGVPGLAFVIARVAALESAPPPRSVSLDLAAQWRGLGANGQFRFTPPTHVLLALEAALLEHAREGGIAGRADRYRRNHERLIAGMRRLGFREVVDPTHQSDIITSFFEPDDRPFEFEAFYRDLRARNFVIYPGKLTDANCFRIGTIGRIFPEDVDTLLDAIEKVLASRPFANSQL